MKLVIPCFNFNESDLLNQIKQLVVCLKSYYYHGNTMETVVPTNSRVVVDVVDTLARLENWNAHAWYMNGDLSKYKQGYQAKRPNIIPAKLYTLFNVCIDEDIFVCDYDTMFTAWVDWDSLRGKNIKMFVHPCWNHPDHVTIRRMLSICAHDHNIDYDGYIDTVCDSMNWDRSLLDSPWLNAGLIFFSSEYRKTKLNDLCSILSHEVYSTFTGGEEERLYAHMLMTRSPDLERVTSTLNVPVVFYREDISDVFKIPDVSMVHFERAPKPHQYTLTKDGFLILRTPTPLWNINYNTTKMELRASSHINCLLFTALWQYYFSLVSQPLRPLIQSEYIHSPQTYLDIFENYKQSYVLWKNIFK